MFLSDTVASAVQGDASAQCCDVVWIVKSAFIVQSTVSSDSTQPRVPISNHFSQEAVNSLFMGNLTLEGILLPYA